MRTGWGVYLPNEGDPKVGEAIEIARDGCYTLLHTVTGRDNALRRIRAEQPDALILVRCYLPNWYAVDPVQWAADVWTILHGGSDPIVRYTRRFTWANEQNLALESGGMVGASDGRQATWRDYVNIAAWNDAFIEAYLKLTDTSEDILHYPALATGHGEDWGRDRNYQPMDGFPVPVRGGDPTVAYELLRAGISRCAVLNVHPYKQPGHPATDEWEGVGRIQRVTKLFPGFPLFVDETGQFEITADHAPQDLVDIGYYLQGLQAPILGWTPFILGSSDQGHNSNNWSLNPKVAEAYKKTTRIPVQDYVKPATPAPPPAGGPLVFARAIDVSNNNGWVDWDEVASHPLPDLHGGVPGIAIAKASGDEGSRHRFVDGDFKRNWPEMKRVGLIRGAYHYAKPSLVSPEVSVATFLEVVEANGGFDLGDFYALDLEDPDVPVGVSLAVWASEWLDLAERLTGFPGMLYTGNYYMAEHDLYQDSIGARWKLWLASYQDSIPPTPKGWQRITLWQNNVIKTTSIIGNVYGVQADCDVNALLVPMGEFVAAVGCPTAKPPPPVTPPPIDEVTDSLNNLFDLTLDPGPHNEERRRSAQAAIGIIKRHLGV